MRVQIVEEYPGELLQKSDEAVRTIRDLEKAMKPTKPQEYPVLAGALGHTSSAVDEILSKMEAKLLAVLKD